MTVEEMQRAFEELSRRHAHGELDDEAYLEQVRALRLQDAEGRWWTIGARTGQWYVAQEGRWVQAEPPVDAAPAAAAPSPEQPEDQQAPASRMCPNCGAAIAEGAHFCPECGQPVTGGAPAPEPQGTIIAQTPPAAPSVAPDEPTPPRPVTRVSSPPPAPGPQAPPPVVPPPVGPPRVTPPPVTPPPAAAPASAPPPKPPRKKGLTIALAVVGVLLIAGALVVAASAIPGAPGHTLAANLLGRGGAATTAAPTATLTPTATEIVAAAPADTATPTNTLEPSPTATVEETPAKTATFTLTAVVHTATLIPTHTQEPTATATATSTATPEPTATPKTPTTTPSPSDTPTPTRTPQPTASPLTVASSTTVDNGGYGTNTLEIWHMESIFVNGSDGGRYRAELGFLTSPEARNAIQQQWAAQGLGEANWKGIIKVVATIDWVACTSDKNVCYDNRSLQPAPVAQHVYEVHLRNHVWQSLLNDYIAGGLQATLRNPYYAEIQRVVFGPMTSSGPSVPCLGFKFERQ